MPLDERERRQVAWLAQELGLVSSAKGDATDDAPKAKGAIRERSAAELAARSDLSDPDLWLQAREYWRELAPEWARGLIDATRHEGT